MNKRALKFCLWFTAELAGTWSTWASYMAIKFMTEVGQGQRASFSVHQANGQVGAFIILPALVTIVWTIASALFISTREI